MASSLRQEPGQSPFETKSTKLICKLKGGENMVFGSDNDMQLI
jgi:hypothetical protein